MWEYFAPNQPVFEGQILKKRNLYQCISYKMDGRGVAIDRLISSHIWSIGTTGPTYNIRSKI